MDKEFDIDSLVGQMDFESNKFNNINGLMLTNREVEVLDRYNINYKNSYCYNNTNNDINTTFVGGAFSRGSRCSLLSFINRNSIVFAMSYHGFVEVTILDT